MKDDLTIIVNGKTWGGWTAVRVTRGVEIMPASFDIELTELYPDAADVIDVKPGYPCQVKIGDDLVLTGYVDRYCPDIGPTEHTVRISGRSKSEDLVDCSAEATALQIASTSTLDLAQRLAKPYGIGVSSLSGPGPAIPQMNIALTDTPWEIIEMTTRYSGLLAYDDTNGDILLSEVGKIVATGGFEQGVNIMSASVALTMDERFHDIIAVTMSVDSTQDIATAAGGNPGLVANSTDRATDAAVRPARQKVIVAEQIPYHDTNLAKATAEWEVARRWGRSQSVKLITDSWRDGAGKLWAPNTTAYVSIPSERISKVNWVISEVTYARDLTSGTTAMITMMPKEAFMPQPALLQQYDAQIGAALAAGNNSPPAAVAPAAPAAPDTGAQSV